MKLAPLSRIFNVKHGNKLDLNKMSQVPFSERAIAFVGRTGERNGLVAFVERLNTVTPYESGLITVALGGSALSSFVQPRPFYTAQNVDVLIPPDNMSLETKLYYCLCIEANRYRYSTFGREANITPNGLLVPAPECVPAWTSGAVEDAVQGLCSDIQASVSETPS